MRGCVWTVARLDGESDGLDGAADGLDGVVRPAAAEEEWAPCDPQAASSAAANAPPHVRAARVTARRTTDGLMFMSTLP
jgi:hypothetical protein